MEEQQPVINNFNIDAQSLVAWIAQGERRAVLQTLVNNGVLNTLDGLTFEGLIYENWSEKSQEGHEPIIKSINIVYDKPEDVESSEAEVNE